MHLANTRIAHSSDEALSPFVRHFGSRHFLSLSSFILRLDHRFAPFILDRLKKKSFTPGNRWKRLTACGCAATSFPKSIKNLVLSAIDRGNMCYVDLMRFEDGIAIISMESECVMHFSRDDLEIGAHEAKLGRDDSPAKARVMLNPGSLVLMSGEARYSSKHEINRADGFQIWKGKEILQ
ncbi:hypothetical protein KSP39_PZI009501 [Platanthera zijinensis]|uniref:Alpha-ketoglutarate-dependent dioxygenase AlkB-like domain-containing protein n=1 Tax=Platanthera zijinensis TaxID=2320716 RepID=A0AAP0BLE9_9ASPA